MDNSTRSRYVPLLVLSFTLLCLLAANVGLRQVAAAQTARQPAAPDPQSATTHVLLSTADRLQFTLDVPPVSVDANGVVRAPGLQASGGLAGAPALPVFSTFIALPPGAEATVDVEAGDVSSQIVDYVQPSPNDAGMLQGEDVASLVASPRMPVYDAAQEVYDRDEPYPGRLYTLSPPMYYRDLRLVKLELYPVRYNPVRRTLEQFIMLNVTVDIRGADLSSRRPLSAEGS
ncbi:MAG TPA: C25 family peptidase propeptide domain-containing protein, partial [Candidatus Binatia bacterium]|nr:C25 family peptidase propeptide domain-containing protein [Candidatus Binatia bacterium]